MFNGDDSVVWVRGDATITIGDLRKLAALLKGQQMIIIKDVKTTSDETTQLYTIIIRYIENGQELERITSAQTIIELFNTLRDLDKADGDV